MVREFGIWDESKDAVLVLEDGSVFWGYSFGSKKDSYGEVVFNTGMVGYCKSLTDPSYYGQILTFTYPLIGNYGVPSYEERDEFSIPKYFESVGIKVRGVVVSEFCQRPNHYSSVKSISAWLKEEGIPGISGVDTRELTKVIRERGTMKGVIKVFNNGEMPNVDSILKYLREVEMPDSRELIDEVSIKEPIFYGESSNGDGNKLRVVLLDCGVKLSILRSLLMRGVEVIRVPHSFSFDEIMEYRPSALVISNGPGDPRKAKNAIEVARESIGENLPTFGICLGNQIIGLACGMKVYKLKYGHRSQNQPCIDLDTGECYITSQNHGYALEDHGRNGLKVWFKNINDGTVEGVRHLKKPVLGVQFHPEANPGPRDAEFLFDFFLDKVRGYSSHA
ncbi:MAG: glutamine-hydrolyzing carbamoyl-phosphate synthase small subunit [Candidatus Asgardarchaeia archaeon]